MTHAPPNECAGVLGRGQQSESAAPRRMPDQCVGNVPREGPARLLRRQDIGPIHFIKADGLSVRRHRNRVVVGVVLDVHGVAVRRLQSDEQFLGGLAATLLADAVDDEECDHQRFTIDVCEGAFKFEGRAPTMRKASQA